MQDRERISPVQLFFLTFSYLYGGFILSRGGWEAEENAWIAALLGTAAGILWYFFLGMLGKNGFSFGKMGKIACFFLFLALMWGNLEDYGRFCHGELIPQIPPTLYAMALAVLCLYASTLGVTVLGRFGEVSAFALAPLLLLLFFGFFGAAPAGSLVPSLSGGIGKLLKGARGVFLSTFGDGVLLLSLSDRVTVRSSASASVQARADARTAKQTFPRLSRLRLPLSPFPRALLLGAAAAGILLCVTTVRDQRAIGARMLSSVRFPFSYASHETQSEVFMPFFTLCLLLVFAERTMLLFGECARYARSLLPGYESMLPTAGLFSLLALSSVRPEAADAMKNSRVFACLFVLIAFAVPIFGEIRIVLQKRFDKSARI